MKEHLKGFRDLPIISSLLRLPFLMARGLGFQIPESIYQHLPYKGVCRVACPDGASFQLACFGNYLENNIYWRGIYGYEEESIAPWISFCKDARVIIDVGANTGFYSLVAAANSPSAHIYAFEPVARIAMRFRNNLELNPALKINLNECAVAEKNGTADLFDPGGESPYSSSLDGDFLSNMEKKKYEVRTVSLDGFLEEQSIDCLDLVKIDVDGGEESVLKGMVKTIKRYRPTILLEFLSEDRAGLMAQIRGLLDQDYELHNLELEGLRLCDGIKRSVKSMNVILNPKERPIPCELMCRAR